MANKTPIKKSAKSHVKRVNKTEHQVLMEMQATQRMDHAKELSRKVFPIIGNLDTIYDAQTVVNALSGFIMPHIENYMSKIKLSDLPIIESIAKEEDSAIKTAIETLIVEFKDEPAKQLSGILDRFGASLSQYGANEFLKKPMSEIKVDNIVSK